MIGAATLFGLVFAVQHYVYLRVQEEPAPIGQLLVIHLARWYLWVALSPFIFAIARRWRIGGRRRWRRVAIQAVAALGFALLHAVLSAFVDHAIGATHAPLARTLTEHIIALFAGAVVVYVAIVAAYYAIEYYRRYRQRELRASQLETRLAHTRLQVLRMQLQPHFLFNTLNTVASLMHQDVDAADAMLAALSDLLRLALHSDGSPEVPLRQEVEFLRRYLDVMRIRFGTRLTTHLQIDPAALDALVPTLLLQPLVENAVRHGVAQQLGGGCVEVRAERVSGTLRLRIADDGPGLPDGWSEAQHGGLGLRNTRARLRQLYGAAHDLAVTNRPEGGVELTVTVPYRAATPPPSPDDVRRDGGLLREEHVGAPSFTAA
jgi:two-component system LytT family sensor kinase